MALLYMNIKMKVNTKKTQLLCIHPFQSDNINTYIRSGNDIIKSEKTLKILGFTFDQKPDASCHVKLLVKKFCRMLWSLRFLKQSGMDIKDLMTVYRTTVRPVVEYSSVIYNSLIPEYLSQDLERIQRHAMKIIHGWHVNYSDLLENETIQTLKERRNEATVKFALKAEKNEKFSSKWFKKKEELECNLRDSSRRKYEEKLCRTERFRKNPVNRLTAILNDHYCKE